MELHSMHTARTGFEYLISKLGAEKHLRRIDNIGYVSIDIEAIVDNTNKIYIIYPLKEQPIYFANKAQLGLRLLKLLDPEELDELATRI
jgi:hypothetical protein